MAKDPYRYFRVEARELLDQLGSGVLDLERGQPAIEVVPRLLRLAHTLKGAARVVKQREIADAAHALEDCCAPFRGGGAPTRQALDRILELLEAMRARLAGLAPPEAADPASAAGAGAAPLEELYRTLRADVTEIDTLLEDISQAQGALVALRRTLSGAERLGRLATLQAARAGREGGDGERRLAAIAGRAEEPATLAALATDLERGARRSLEQVERQLRQVREGAERLRLLPADTVFNALERTVHDAARSLGRRVAFRARGGALRMDGHVLASLQTALLQVVRNAVAHGLEPPDERLASGKPAEGSVSVEVARRGSRIAWVCRDDGRGVDMGAVRRALLERGVLRGAPEAVPPEQVLQALIGGGVTTSQLVTEVSGRGVGLDVVREVVSSLAGSVRLDTQPGQGTTVEIVVPVSLSSLEALIVEAAGLGAAIPLAAVRRTLRLADDEVSRAATGEAILFEGGLIPFLPLSRLLDGGARSAPRSGISSAVVLAAGADVAAIGVDRLLGAASLLVRPLPRLAGASAVVSGASVDDEGNARLVLDAERLVAAAQRTPATPLARHQAPARVLVVDDSLTTRMLEQSILESAGYRVEVAASGEEALEKARREPYALMLIDVEMPGMDGFALLDQLRGDAQLRGVPAMLVTSRASSEDRLRGAQLGARAYIVKSEFDQVELLQTIRRLLGGA